MDSFIARQPIFDREGKVYGYELLFRSGLENAIGGADLNFASSKVLSDSFLLLGLDTLTADKRAFINVTEHVLLNDYIQLFPRDRTVVELMEVVEPTPWAVDACRRLKRSGCLIALDDFVWDGRIDDMLELADIVKVDVLATSREERNNMATRFRGTGKLLVAEKVETPEMYDEVRDLGYDLFQGYFFARPKILSAQDVPAYKQHYFQILREIQKQGIDFDSLEEILKHEVSLCYKLLRYINSVFFSWRSKVDSVRRALVLLGEREFKKWAALMIMASMAKEKPEELLVQSVIRARFAETLAPFVGLADRAQDLFLMGMFSMIDAFLDRPLEEILEDLPVADEVRGALLGEGGLFGHVLRYVTAYERADWLALAQEIELPGVEEADVPRLYLDALEWGSRSFFGNGVTDDRAAAG